MEAARGTVFRFGDNVDTDVIIPARYLATSEPSELAAHCMEDIDKTFIQKVKKGDMIVAGRNFGCGSSREHAAWALKDYRFRVIIAGSYSDIFYMNSLKNGLLLIELPQEQRDALAQLPADETIQIDLPNQVVRTNAAEYPFAIDPTWKHKLENGIDDITETMAYKDEIDAYEAKWDNIYA